MKTRNYPLQTTWIGGALLLSFCLPGFSDTVAYWSFNSLSITTPGPPGSSASIPTTISADTGTGTVNLAGYLGNVASFGGSTVNLPSGGSAGASLSLQTGGSAAPFPGNGSYIEVQLDLTNFLDPVVTYATQRTSTGYNSNAWSYSTGGAFTPVGSPISPATSYSLQTLDLSSIDALDGAATVTLRYTFSGGTSASGNNRIDNLSVSATAVGGDLTPPAIASRIPADDAVNVTLDSVSQLTLTFNEPIAVTTGNILVKKVSDNSVVNSLDVTDFGQISLNEATLGLNMVNPLAASTSYYVEIPAGTITDLAPAPNAFPGLSGPAAWNFTTAAPPTPPTVVINKYLNGSPDRVELLVIGAGTPGSTVDLRGMILKDFSGDTELDNGGSYTFSTDSLWSAVPAGTLITLPVAATAGDTDHADFDLNVGLQNETYFDVTDGDSFNIAGIDMVMIKAAGSGVDGITGGIHALSGGLLDPGSLFTAFAGAKVRTDGASATNQGVRVLNSDSNLDDFISGTDAEGGVTLAAGDFGVPNGLGNAAYIAALRGLNPGDGDGAVTLVNVTPSSPYLNLGFFDNGQTAQSARVSILSQTTGITLTNVTIEVPSALGAPSGATLAGPGASGANAVVNGQLVTITGADATTTDALEVTINGLTTPTPTLVTETGNYPLVVSTSASGGTLTPIAAQPAVRVPIPIASLRDVDANGVSLDSGLVVAVEGIVTEEDFGDGIANFSGFIQDTTAGINIFSATNNPGLVRGHRVAVLGTVTQFNGLTEIIPAAVTDVVDLGVDAEPAPLTITLADLLAAPETYEGTLVTVTNMTDGGGTWGGTGSNIQVLAQGGNEIDVFIAAGSTATTEPTYPVTVTAIFSQRDTNPPLTAGYQLQPRTQSDLVPGTSGYATWASSNGIPGEAAEDDFDNDGLSNLLEYGLGLTPAVPNGTPGTLVGNVLTFTKGADAMTNGDVDWTIESSPTLGAAPSPWTTVPATEVGNTISYTLPTGQGKVFVRLVVAP